MYVYSTLLHSTINVFFLYSSCTRTFYEHVQQYNYVYCKTTIINTNLYLYVAMYESTFVHCSIVVSPKDCTCMQAYFSTKVIIVATKVCNMYVAMYGSTSGDMQYVAMYESTLQYCTSVLCRYTCSQTSQVQYTQHSRCQLAQPCHYYTSCVLLYL